MISAASSRWPSSIPANGRTELGIPHFDSKFRIEEHLRGTGLRFTIVRPVFFMENWLDMRQAIDDGALALPLDPATRLQMIALDDIGGIVAMAIEHPGKWQDRARNPPLRQQVPHRGASPRHRLAFHDCEAGVLHGELARHAAGDRRWRARAAARPGHSPPDDRFG